ncbi:hypothetical protein B0T20DRAFT_357917, partial [Sordaria brevicollis]
YIYILLSLKLAINTKFKAILRLLKFYKKIGLFIIDELYCILKWRDFYKEF